MALKVVHYRFLYSTTFSNITGMIHFSLHLTIVGCLSLIGAWDFAVFSFKKKYKRKKKGKNIKKEKKEDDSLIYVLWALERSLPYAPVLLFLLLDCLLFVLLCFVFFVFLLWLLRFCGYFCVCMLCLVAFLLCLYILSVFSSVHTFWLAVKGS